MQLLKKLPSFIGGFILCFTLFTILGNGEAKPSANEEDTCFMVRNGLGGKGYRIFRAGQTKGEPTNYKYLDGRLQMINDYHRQGYKLTAVSRNENTNVEEYYFCK